LSFKVPTSVSTARGRGCDAGGGTSAAVAVIGEGRIDVIEQRGAAVTGIDAIHRFNDCLSTQIRINVGSNCDGFHLLLGAHDMFERRPEFVG